MLPGLQILNDYQAAWFARDVMAGLMLSTMLVPFGIAYALALTNKALQPIALWRCASSSILITVSSTAAQPRFQSGG